MRTFARMTAARWARRADLPVDGQGMVNAGSTS